MYVNFERIAEDAEKSIREELAGIGAEPVSATEIGLDARAGRVYVTGGAILVEGRTASIEYYGGFEYVDNEHITRLGNFTIYWDSDERVRDAIEQAGYGK